ncbi:MAG: ABC transporter permease [Rhodospirillales bacterium]
MLTYVIKRILIMIPTLLAISALVFFIIHLPPGDFLSTQIDELMAQGGPKAMQKIDELRREYGLDQPLVVRYFHWIVGIVAHGDFGFSFEYQLPVTDVIGERIALTMLLESCTIIFIWVVSFTIGVYAATHQYKPGDYFASFIGFIGLATPNFLLALVLLYLAKVWFGISVGGLMDPRFVDQPWSWDKTQSILSHLVIPVVVIGTAGTAGMIRRLRANLLDELQKQYVVTGRAKGLPPMRLLLKYPLRHALNPFIADIGHILPEVISGSVIVSVVLSLPTTGPLLLSALKNQDTYLAGTFLLFVATLTVVGTLVSDLLLAWLDPRIRLGAKAEK